MVFAVFSRLWHQKKFNAVISPNPWKHSYLHSFLQFFHVPMPLANSNIYTKNRSKTLFFFSAFLHFFRQKHRNLHVFRLKVSPKHWFLQCFQCSGIKNHSKYRYLQCFFISVRFSLAGSRPKWPKIPFQYLLSSDTQKSSKKHANTTNTRSRCEIVFAPPS